MWDDMEVSVRRSEGSEVKKNTWVDLKVILVNYFPCCKY